MIGRACAFVLMFVAATASRLAAGEFNPVLNIGDPAPAWERLEGVDGKRHSLSDLKDKEFVVVAFTCNSCPIATDYEERMIEFANKYAGADKNAAVVAINVNTVEEDRLPKMKERSEAKKLPYPYLYDSTQKIARDYGAVFTPEFFVLNRDRKIVYMGGFDDNSEASRVKQRYLASAFESLLHGRKPAPAETVARGCQIRYDRSRRRKPAASSAKQNSAP